MCGSERDGVVGEAMGSYQSVFGVPVVEEY